MAKWLPGQSGNPGGLSVRQMRTRNMIEGLGVTAVKRLAKALDSDNETVALGAVKIVLDRVAPAPRTGTLDVKVQDSSAAHLQALLNLARRRVDDDMKTIEAEPISDAATPETSGK